MLKGNPIYKLDYFLELIFDAFCNYCDLVTSVDYEVD